MGRYIWKEGGRVGASLSFHIRRHVPIKPFERLYRHTKGTNHPSPPPHQSNQTIHPIPQMARHTTATRTTATRRPAKPGLMSRLRSKPRATPATVETHSSKNPITGTTTTTTTTKQKTHAHGVGHHGHGGTGPMASSGRRAPATHQRRKPSMGDKVSGALTKLKGSLTRKPGKKVS